MEKIVLNGHGGHMNDAMSHAMQAVVVIDFPCEGFEAFLYTKERQRHGKAVGTPFMLPVDHSKVDALLMCCHFTLCAMQDFWCTALNKAGLVLQLNTPYQCTHSGFVFGICGVQYHCSMVMSIPSLPCIKMCGWPMAISSTHHTYP